MSPSLSRSLAVVALVVFGLAGLAAARWLATLPDLTQLAEYRPALPTEVRARGGEKIGEFAAERRRLITLDEVPPHVVQAFLAAEDARFYDHGGLDLAALSRAAWVNLSAGGRIRQGGSTITQQLAKSLLGNERTMSRKLRDMALALRIEWRFDKDEILTLYLNEIYLGNGAYGVAQAARSYFDVDVAHLDVSQAALIAGLTKAPSKYAPDVNPEAAEERRRYVLDQMRLLGHLDAAEYRAALAAPPLLRAPQTPEAFTSAAWFVEEVRRLLVERLGADALLRGGYVVETTLDLSLQRNAEQAVRTGIDRFEKRGEQERARLEAPIEAALVSLDVARGDVLALVGGYDFAQSQFNRATQARRQPGSAFKPFVYGAALESGFQVSASLYDVQVDLRDRRSGRRWKPRNSSGSLRGIVPMHEALARSLNNATVRLLMDVGVERSVAFARRAGIVAPLAEDYGIALGTSGVSPLELTCAYATIASGGIRHAPRFITRVLDRDGEVALADLSLLDETKAPAAADLPPLAPIDAYLLTHLLRQPIRQGYGTAHAAARLGAPLAGKTGSTNENRDAWFVGFSPRIATGVWVGRDRLAPLGRSGTGARAALPIWIEFMDAALDEGDVETAFPIPEGVHFAGKDRESGSWIRTERFIPGFEPYAVGRRIRKSTVVALPKPPEPVPVTVAVQTPATSTPGPVALPLIIPNGIDGLPSVGAGPLRPAVGALTLRPARTVSRAALLAFAFACGPGPAPPGEIALWALGVEGEVVAGLVPAFEHAHPGLRVRVQQIPWSAAHEKLLTAFVGESLPDVFQLGVTWIPEFAALGALEPIGDRADALRADHFEGVWDANVIDGTLLALPWYVDTRLFFQRRDLFAAAGVAEMPRTWEAWRDALGRVQRSLGADRHVLFAPPTEWELPVVQALSRGASLLRDGDRFGNFQSDAFRAAFAFHLSLYDRGLAARGGAGATASLYRDFAEGWFTAFLSGPWNLGQLAERLPPALADAWTTAPLPGVDADRPGVSIAGGASLAIRKGTPNADAAWQLIAWLAEPAQQLALYRSAGDLPPRRSTWADPALAHDARVAAFRVQLESVRALPKVPEWERIAAAIARHTEAAVRGETPPDAALAALDHDVDRILQKRRQLGAGPDM